MSKLIHKIVDNCTTCPYILCPNPEREYHGDCWLCDNIHAPNGGIILESEDYVETAEIPSWCPLPDFKVQQKPLVFFSQLYACRQKTIQTMTWMLSQLKWHYRQTKNIPDDLPDSEVDWSTEMKEAMALLEELCQ